MAAAVELLNALKRLPENKQCVNCGADSQFGHGNIVEKFRSFVCGDCKSAHQSFSHRVKVTGGGFRGTRACVAGGVYQSRPPPRALARTP
jgi:hypothetical protein